jgi:hypothetical protein
MKIFYTSISNLNTGVLKMACQASPGGIYKLKIQTERR